MECIHRYELLIDDRAEIRMPVGAQIRKIGVRHSEEPIISVWAQVSDSENPALETRSFRIAGTGHGLWEADDVGRYDYIDSVIHEMYGQVLVWHVFEVFD